MVGEIHCLLRGGGDLGSGVAWRLNRCGFGVTITELAAPLTVRRTVAFSSAVTAGRISIEGVTGRLVNTPDQAQAVVGDGDVAVLVTSDLPAIATEVVIDARLAKRNIDTTIDDAPLVIGLGPGFTAGLDCHAVVETMRGPRLGRALWKGSALPNTGSPGRVGGRDVERVLRADVAGVVSWLVDIGDVVHEGVTMGRVGDSDVTAPFDGAVRGLIADGSTVPAGLKIGDVDPRLDVACNEISDKALAVGGGVVEAIMTRFGPRW